MVAIYIVEVDINQVDTLDLESYFIMVAVIIVIYSTYGMEPKIHPWGTLKQGLYENYSEINTTVETKGRKK